MKPPSRIIQDFLICLPNWVLGTILSHRRIVFLYPCHSHCVGIVSAYPQVLFPCEYCFYGRALIMRWNDFFLKPLAEIVPFLAEKVACLQEESLVTSRPEQLEIACRSPWTSIGSQVKTRTSIRESIDLV
jgi:hypothetical protein